MLTSPERTKSGSEFEIVTKYESTPEDQNYGQAHYWLGHHLDRLLKNAEFIEGERIKDFPIDKNDQPRLLAELRKFHGLLPQEGSGINIRPSEEHSFVHFRFSEEPEDIYVVAHEMDCMVNESEHNKQRALSIHLTYPEYNQAVDGAKVELAIRLVEGEDCLRRECKFVGSKGLFPLENYSVTPWAMIDFIDAARNFVHIPEEEAAEKIVFIFRVTGQKFIYNRGLGAYVSEEGVTIRGAVETYLQKNPEQGSLFELIDIVIEDS